MFSSKFCYMVAGFDIAFALLNAMMHNLMGLVMFIAAGFLMHYIGDKKRQIEQETMELKGDE